MEPKRKPCKECGQAFPISELSHRGYCKECGIKRMLDAQEQIRGYRERKAVAKGN